MTTAIKEYDVIVIGAGPGGLNAALYASRSNLKTLILERGAAGGELLNTSEIENYLGFGTIEGFELAQKLKGSSMRFGAEEAYGEVKAIKKEGDDFIVEVVDDTYKAKAVIIATGAYNKELGVKGEDKLKGHGVSYCAVCDGFFYRDQEVVVVGGGDSAVEEAVYLTQFAKKVTIIHRRDKLRAIDLLVNRAKKNEKIEFLFDSVVEEIVGDELVEGVKVRNVKTEEVHTLPAQGVFVYVGVLPNSDLVTDFGVVDETGWIITDERMQTSVPGLFAVGDVRNTPLRQVITAVGDGAIAGYYAYQYIEGLKDN